MAHARARVYIQFWFGFVVVGLVSLALLRYLTSPYCPRRCKTFGSPSLLSSTVRSVGEAGCNCAGSCASAILFWACRSRSETRVISRKLPKLTVVRPRRPSSSPGIPTLGLKRHPPKSGEPLRCALRHRRDKTSVELKLLNAVG